MLHLLPCSLVLFPTPADPQPPPVCPIPPFYLFVVITTCITLISPCDTPPYTRSHHLLLYHPVRLFSLHVVCCLPVTTLLLPTPIVPVPFPHSSCSRYRDPFYFASCCWDYLQHCVVPLTFATLLFVPHALPFGTIVIQQLVVILLPSLTLLPVQHVLPVEQTICLPFPSSVTSPVLPCLPRCQLTITVLHSALLPASSTLLFVPYRSIPHNILHYSTICSHVYNIYPFHCMHYSHTPFYYSSSTIYSPNTYFYLYCCYYVPYIYNSFCWVMLHYYPHWFYYLYIFPYTGSHCLCNCYLCRRWFDLFWLFMWPLPSPFSYYRHIATPLISLPSCYYHPAPIIMPYVLFWIL